MKKIIRLTGLVMTAAALSLIQSCKEEDIGPAPVVSLNASTGQDIPGATVTITATVSAANGGQVLLVYVNGDEVESFDIAGAADFEQDYDYDIPASAVVGSLITISFQAIDNKNFPSEVANFKLTVGDPVITLAGNLTTQTLDAANPYLLQGQVFIPTGVVLTIPAGTVIKGDKASKATLIVQPGGQLIANGTSTNPVVFTSAQSLGERDRGDWGGIIILGNAFVNQAARPAIEGISPTQNYGQSLAEAATPATNATENSGTLQFVRIEYAGIELTPNNETNSLTMGGVGNGTTIDNVQVSFGGDDGFEWFGGTVNAKHLISLSTWDDDFDTDFGWGGNVQWGLVVRNPFFADQSGSNAFESDNAANGNTIAGVCDGSTQAGCTRGVFSNITVLGPRETSTRTISANYQNLIHYRRRTSISIFNSFFSAYRVGIRLDDQGSLDNLISGAGVLANNVLAVTGTTRIGASTTAADANFATGLSAGDATAIATYWTNNTNTDFNTVTNTSVFADLGISTALYWAGQTSANYPSNPNFVLIAGVAGPNNLNDGEDFSNGKLTGGFFTTTTYRGAFGATTDWTDGWSEFQPLNRVY